MPVGVSAYVPLATKTLTATATSVTFSSISQAYRDLVLSFSGSTTATKFSCSINGITSNFVVEAVGDGLFEASLAMQSSTIAQNDTVVGDGAILMNVMDYSATNKNKNLLVRINYESDISMYVIGVATTAAVTSLTISGGTLAIGSTFTLYGIAS